MGFAGLVAGRREASIPECSCDTGPNPHRIRSSPASGSWYRCSSGCDCSQCPGEPDRPRKHACTFVWAHVPTETARAGLWRRHGPGSRGTDAGLCFLSDFHAHTGNSWRRCHDNGRKGKHALLPCWLYVLYLSSNLHLQQPTAYYFIISGINRMFSTKAYFACLSLLTHLIQIISLLEVRSMHELCSDWHAPYTGSIAPYSLSRGNPLKFTLFRNIHSWICAAQRLHAWMSMTSYTSVNIYNFNSRLAHFNALWMEYIRSLRTGIMAEYPVMSTSQGTYVRIEQTSEAIRVTYEICRARGGGGARGLELRTAGLNRKLDFKYSMPCFGLSSCVALNET